jgi:hypothetical protein
MVTNLSLTCPGQGFMARTDRNWLHAQTLEAEATPTKRPDTSRGPGHNARGSVF